MRTYPRPNLEILTLVQNLITDHTQAGDIIKEIETLTDHFTAPADACPTFKRTYSLLEELFNDIFVHIFKENSIVFPEGEMDAQVEQSLQQEQGSRNDECGYCAGEENGEAKSQVLFECGDCGTLYCNDCGETGCPTCGAPFSHAHPIEYSGSRGRVLLSEPTNH
ncbi:hemerythrin domain-containing protein, partial [Acidaminococcus timonensis]